MTNFQVYNLTIEELQELIRTVIAEELTKQQPKQPEILTAPDGEKYLSKQETMKMLNICSSKLYEHSQGFRTYQGERFPVKKLNSIKIGRKLLYRTVDVVKFINEYESK